VTDSELGVKILSSSVPATDVLPRYPVATSNAVQRYDANCYAARHQPVPLTRYTALESKKVGLPEFGEPGHNGDDKLGHTHTAATRRHHNDRPDDVIQQSQYDVIDNVMMTFHPAAAADDVLQLRNEVTLQTRDLGSVGRQTYRHAPHRHSTTIQGEVHFEPRRRRGELALGVADIVLNENDAGGQY